MPSITGPKGGGVARPEPITPLVPLVPREMVVAPFFAAVKQTQEREVVVDGRRWVIGMAHPTKRRPSPALDMRHGRACFTLLSFRDRLQNGREIFFSMNEFCRRYASSQGGRYASDILNVLFDLQETWVAREVDAGKVEYFQILGDIKIHQKTARRREALKALSMQQEMWLDRVTLSPEFFGLLRRWEELTRICLHVLTSIRSPKAQAIYTYIPSRAIHHTRSEPFSINLATILEQIGAPVPSAKSRRRQIFVQNNHSILSQLNGAEVVDGILRAELAETRDGTDLKLLFWVEKGRGAEAPVVPPRKSKMLEAWMRGGRSRSSFQERLKKAGPLRDHHLDLLERAGADLEASQTFFEMAYALLGPRFEQGSCRKPRAMRSRAIAPATRPGASSTGCCTNSSGVRTTKEDSPDFLVQLRKRLVQLRKVLVQLRKTGSRNPL